MFARSLRAAGFALVIAGCGGGKGASTATSPGAAAPTLTTTGAPTTNVQIASEEVSFTVAGRKVPGTFVHPASGKRPAVLLMAGSGPLDRNWNTPLQEGTNGSGRLLAEALARRGFAVLRFDKAGAGGNQIKVEQLDFDTFMSEGRAALAWMRTQPGVDPAHLFVAGHDEGGIRASRVAQAEGKGIAGLLLLAAPGRPMRTVMLAQLAQQFEIAENAGDFPKSAGDAELAAVTKAFDDFDAGKPVDASKVGSVLEIQQRVAQITQPMTADVIRPLFAFDPTATLASIAVPVFLYNGVRDIHVDSEIDTKLLAKARPNATVFLAPDANHVLKHETRHKTKIVADLAAVERDYVGADTDLDPASVDAIAQWLARTSK